MTSGAIRRRLECMRAIEVLARRPVFDRDPYIKFVPWILYSPEMDLSMARRCSSESRRRIVIVAYGRDRLAFDGWMRFATLAAYSLVHCRTIEEWGIDLVVGDAPEHRFDLPIAELFGDSMESVLEGLTALGVRIIHLPNLASPAELYHLYSPATVDVLLRLDADAGLLPDTLGAPCFTFTDALGHSGLNLRHTGRSALAQLVAPRGRMSQWPEALRRSETEWVRSVLAAGKDVLGTHSDMCEVRARMENVPWLSEGLSYLKGEYCQHFAALRAALIDGGVVPAWDEECVKLALVSLLDLTPECSSQPVLEHSEYQPGKMRSATVNFRNVYSLGAKVRHLLDRGDVPLSAFSYLQDFAADIRRLAVSPERI